MSLQKGKSAAKNPLPVGASVWYFTPYRGYELTRRVTVDETTGVARYIAGGLREGGFWSPGGKVVDIAGDQYVVEIFGGWDKKHNSFFRQRRVYQRNELKTKASRQVSA